jgi:hypothetical protein
VEPDAPRKTDYFLNILKPALNPTEKMPNTRRIESGSAFGAEIVKDGTKYTLVFSKDGLEAPKLEIQRGN